MIQIVFGAIPGFNQSKIGTTKRDVCSPDMRSVEPRNITPSQISNGSQYLMNDFIRKSEAGDQGSAEANAEHPTLNIERPMGEKECEMSPFSN
jgi:hypothetical protein